MKIHFEKIGYKSILILLMGMGLISCRESNDNTLETDRENIRQFNGSYAPEGKIINNLLYVDWKENKEERLEPLKLKIPLEYLDRVIDKNGRINQWRDAFLFKARDSKNKNNEYMIYQINFKLLRNGQPIDAKYFGKLEDDLDRESESKYSFISTTKKILTGQPLGENKPCEISDSKIRRTWCHYYKNMYEIKFSNGSGGEYALKMNNTNRYYRTGTGELIKVKHENGLDHYQTYKCYDTNQLKQTVKDQSMGYGGAQNLLDELKNKPVEDKSPKDCLTYSRHEFWVSPANTQAKDTVGIMCWQLGGCSINFLYKNRHVEVYPLLSLEDTVAQWKDYRNKATQLLKQFENQ